MLDQQSLHAHEARCTQEQPPRCQAACPLRLDIRLFLSHMREGRWAHARKTLERHLPLPGILCRICDHPCEDHCLRRDLGGSLALPQLERACLARTSPSPVLPRPPKATRLVVLGSGLAGLIVAQELSRKGHQVTVRHEGPREEALCRAFPQLDAAHVQAELDRMQGVDWQEIPLDADALHTATGEAEAVFVDRFATPQMVPQREDVDAETLLWQDAICCGGWASVTPTGHSYASAARQAADARRAGQTLERVLGGLSLTAARTDAGTEKQLHADLGGVESVPRVMAQRAEQNADGAYTDDEAKTEAARCCQCQCLTCVRACAYLREHQGYPKQYARQIYNNAGIVKGLHMANSLTNGCTLCGQCTQLCPENFSMAEVCLSARRDMVERSYMPPSAHGFALEDMDSAVEDNALFFQDRGHDKGQDADGSAAQSAWAFFPGCQMWAARGPQLLALWQHLRRLRPEGSGVDLILSCCGIPAHWSGRQARFEELLAGFTRRWEALGSPRLVTGCASCHQIFAETLPQSRPISVWELLDKHGLPPAGTVENRTGQHFSLHDPCTARHNAAWREAVRSLARKCGVAAHEPPRGAENTGCCGYGGLVWNARPELADTISRELAAELPHPALTSCVMCRDRLVAQGKPALHVLDLVLGGGNSAPVVVDMPGALERGPGLSARRANRAALRRQLTGEQENAADADAGAKAPAPALHISPEVLDRLEKRYILRQDAEGAVAHAEATGKRFQELDSGQYVAAWRPRHVTFWVRYSRENGTLVLHEAWCHRMDVPGAGGTQVVLGDLRKEQGKC